MATSPAPRVCANHPELRPNTEEIFIVSHPIRDEDGRVITAAWTCQPCQEELGDYGGILVARITSYQAAAYRSAGCKIYEYPRFVTELREISESKGHPLKKKDAAMFKHGWDRVPIHGTPVWVVGEEGWTQLSRAEKTVDAQLRIENFKNAQNRPLRRQNLSRGLEGPSFGDPGFEGPPPA